MLFCSSSFLIFFVIVFTVFWLTPWHQVRCILLLVASFIFYASWNHWLALLIVVSTLLDYLIALGMERLSSAAWRKFLVILSVVANLGLLVYFKYANFFLESLAQPAAAFGFPFVVPEYIKKVVLPIGISFYTFEAINYTVDVYRGKVKAEHNLFHFMLFILFFPHLMAGPIVRARDFLPQVARPKRFSWLRASIGVRLVLLGIFKKLAIADRLALYVDPVYLDPNAYGTGVLWLSAVAYAIQVYCDFSGYSDMALGLAHLLGFHLAPNFNMPYLSRNMSEFWRRWHISLSTWIRDYVFIPLGGSRGGTWLTYRNLFITMMLAGLWHGATWGYILFGIVQGLMLVVHSFFRSWCETKPRIKAALETMLGTAARIAFTFGCFCYSLVIFRAKTLDKAWEMMARMVTPHTGANFQYYVYGIWITIAVFALGHAVGQRQRLLRLWESLPTPLRGLSFGVALTLALLLAPFASNAFIYFHF